MSYVDGYVLPVRRRAFAPTAAWRRWAARYGRSTARSTTRSAPATTSPRSGAVPFTKLMKLKPGETVVFAYIVYKSRAHRDRVNAKVMKDMNAQGGAPDMPFDMKRMVYGGFKTLVE